MGKGWREDKMVGHVETGLLGRLPLGDRIAEKLRDVTMKLEEAKVRDN